MTTLAISQKVQVCQSLMGRPKIHKAKDPGSDLGPMFREVVGRIFDMMNPFESFWPRIRYSRPTAIYGFGLGDTEMPPEVRVDTENLMHKFQEVLEETARVFKELGWPAMVTPLSQLVCTQAVLNVVQGERYRTIPDEVKKYALGYYGKPLAPPMADGVKVFSAPFTQIAADLGKVVVKNVVALGALQAATGLFPPETFLTAIRQALKSKCAMIPLNEEAFAWGMKSVRKA